MAAADTARLIASLELQDKFSPGVDKVTASLGRLEKASGGGGIARVARGLQGLDRATARTQRSLGRFNQNVQRGVVIGAGAVAAGIGLVVHAASDYESAFAGVRKTVSATEPELKALSDGFREMSKTIPISASELARLGEAGGALGVPTAQLKEFVRVTALLGVTTNLTADEAANSLGILGNVLHLTGDQYSQFASSLVALGNAGASTEADIVAIAERAGAAGALIGISTEQILGFSSATASLGIEAEAGGTALQKFFIDSAKQVAAGGADLKEFAKIAGVTTKDFAASFKKDAGGALQEFLKGLGKLPQAKQLKVLDDLGFNDARITRTLLGLANNTKLVGEQMGVANTAFAENTALTKEADQRFNTFDSQLQITKNTLTDMAITIGSKLLPKITPLLKRLNEFVGNNQAGISKFGDDLASDFEKVADALQKVDWTPFIDGLKLSGQIAGTVISAFRSLPEDLQKLVVAGFALNKVTGGLGTSIAKDIGAAIIGNLAQRGSSPANPLFVVDVAGGLGGAAGAAGAATGLGAAGIAAIATAIVAPVAVGVTAGLVNAGIQDQATALGQQTGNFARDATDAQLASSIDGLRKTVAAMGDGPLSNPFNQKGITVEQLNTLIAEQNRRTLTAESDTRSELTGIRNAVEAGSADTRSESAGIRNAVNGAARLQGAAIGSAINQLASAVSPIAVAIRDLKSAVKPKDIAHAVKEGMAALSKGRGDAGNTKAILDALKGQLKTTHDPKLQATLRSAIAKVEHRLPGREFAAKQLAKADALVRDGKITNRDIKNLQSIERALKDHGLPHAASVIREKIETAKRAQVAASGHTTSAVQRKRWQFTVNNAITVPVSINSVEFSKAHRTSQRAYTTLP